MMSGRDYGPAFRQLTRILNGRATASQGSSQLLERFAANHDASAFEALIDQHGPMVLGTCRRMLTDPNDVDDAFQATFLVLARRAGAIQDADRLGPWLHGVARRVASRSRALSARRQAVERGGGDEPAAEAPNALEATEFRAALDEELARLPEKYRASLVLCYLEGLTHDEAAQKLRWPVGTVRSRLAGGRDRLRSRLTRRGLAPASAVPLALARASIPQALLATTLRVATSPGTVPSQVATLAKGVLIAMFASQLKIVGALGLIAGLTVGGVGLASQQQGKGSGQGKTAEAKAAPRTVEESRDQLDKVGLVNELAFNEKAQATPKPEDELARLQGEWKLTRIRPADDEVQDLTFGMTLTFVGKISSTKSRDNNPFSRNVIVLGEEGGQKTIDFRNMQDIADDKTAERGLYRIDGNILEICAGNPGSPRPTEFKASDDRPYPVICTYKRQPIEGQTNAALQRLEKQLAEQNAMIKLLQNQLDGKNLPSPKTDAASKPRRPEGALVDPTPAKAIVAEVPKAPLGNVNGSGPGVAPAASGPAGAKPRAPESVVHTIPGDPLRILVVSAGLDRLTLIDAKTQRRDTLSLPEGLTEIVPIVGFSQIGFMIKGPKIMKVPFYDFLTQKWVEHDLKDPATEVHTLMSPPSMGGSGMVGLWLKGPKFTRIEVYNGEKKEWATQDLREPVPGELAPVVSQTNVSYRIGRFLYIYSALAGKWSVLEMKREFNGLKNFGEGAGIITPFTPDGNGKIIIQDGDIIHLYDVKTGDWTHIDTSVDK